MLYVSQVRWLMRLAKCCFKASTETSLTTLTLYKTDLQRSWDTTNQASWKVPVMKWTDSIQICERTVESPHTSIRWLQAECKYHIYISWHLNLVIIGSWKTQITKLRSTYPSIKVQSPVMAFNQTWLSTFFATICPPPYSAKDGWGDCSYKPDYVAMHLYTTDPDEFMSTVSTFQKTFGLPLVLSEFACYVSKRSCFHIDNEIDRLTDAI